MAEDQGAAAKAAIDADKKRQDEARKKVADERSAREAAAKEAPASANVKPTPTQEENDLAASGVHTELEADGSPEQLPTGVAATKEAKPAAPKDKAGYTTRSVS